MPINIVGIIMLKEINIISKPICEYCKEHKKIQTIIKRCLCKYCNLNLKHNVNKCVKISQSNATITNFNLFQVL